jgi:hypothetical protein
MIGGTVSGLDGRWLIARMRWWMKEGGDETVAGMVLDREKERCMG